MVTAILIETARWANEPETRRQEWRLAIRELLDDHLFRIDKSPLLMRVSWDDAAALVRFESVNEGVVADIRVERSLLEAPMLTYLDVCRRLSALDGKKAPLTELAALDQEKREAHDLAAKTLAPLFDVVGPTHETLRRIFTLLVVLLVDTTRYTALLRPHGTDIPSHR